LTDDDRWRRTEPPTRGPSAPPDLRFNPLATGIGVFAAVAIPIVVVGYTRSSGPNTTIIVIGVLVGLIAGLLVGLWVDHRDGRVWRGPQF
jgi:high-affinity Fe2+/Pb2+ permease